MTYIKHISRAGILFAIPMLAAAADFQSFLGTVERVLDALIPILVTLALIFFFWGLAKYILQAGDPEGRKAARAIMLQGILTLFVMVSVWGLVSFLADTLEVQRGGTIDLPQAPSGV